MAIGTYIPELTDELIAFWPLTETSGTTVNSTVNNETCVGTAANALGASADMPTTGYGQTFNGTSQWIDLGVLVCLRPRTGFTAACWFKRSATQGSLQRIFAGATYTQGSPDWRIYFNTDNKLYCNAYPDSAPFKSDDAITDTDTAHHVAITYDKPDADATGVWRMYVDGVLQTETMAAQVFYDLQDFGTEMSCHATIGAKYTSGAKSEFFSGSIGGCGCWARCLSIGEIQTLSVATIPVPVAITQVLAGFSPVMNSSAAQLNALWAASPLFTLIGARNYSYVVTVASETIADALTRLAALFTAGGVTADDTHHGAVLIPDGTYAVAAMLNMANYPYFDLIGESRTGTIISYTAAGSSDSTISTAVSSCMVAHCTVKRISSTNTTRYPIHNDGVSGTDRIFLDLDLVGISPPGIYWNGIGTGMGYGDKLWVIGCNANGGYTAHNYNAATTSPALAYFINCTGGMDSGTGNAEVNRYKTDALSWYNYGSGQTEVVTVIGGTYRGTTRGLYVTNAGGTGVSEAEIRLAGVTFSGGVDVDIVADTVVRYGQGGVAPAEQIMGGATTIGGGGMLVIG